MKVCIIGSGGYLGSALADACLKRHDTIQLVSSRTPLGINPVTGMLPTTFEIAANTDVVYYLAQSPHYRNMPTFAPHLLQVNCVSAVQAATAAIQAGAKKFIYASTGNVYETSFDLLSEQSPVNRNAGWYPFSKLMAEDALKQLNEKINLTIMRIFAIYGPHQTDKLVPMLINSVRSGKEIFTERHPTDTADIGGLRVSPIYIDDAVASLLNLATCQNLMVVNLGSNEVISVRDIAVMVGKHLGISPKISMSDKTRGFDLLCDTSLLMQHTKPKFKSFEDGLKQVLSAGT